LKGRLVHPLYPEGKGCANERNESSLSQALPQSGFIPAQKTAALLLA